jgi:Na+/H+ antiporter NhaD/arsenite permease-like protein
MSRSRAFFILALLISMVSLAPTSYAKEGGTGQHGIALIPGADTVNISGFILDNHKEPVDEAQVTITVDEKEVDHLETAHNGKYVSRFQIEKGGIQSATIKIKAYKASFQGKTLTFKGNELANKDKNYYISEDIVLHRVLGPAFWISTVVFVLAYILIAFELLHRTVAAMIGATLMMTISYTIGTIDPAYHIFSFERAIGSIDMNVIFLLMGMMIIVGVLKHTGVFQWCAYFAYKMAKGKVFLLAIYLMVFTAITSAFLDNVTTMLLLTGVAIEICVSLDLNPLDMLIPLVMASNIGGTATLIGGKDYAQAKVYSIEEHIKTLKEEYKITDPALLTYGLAVLGFAVFLFLTHGYWHMEVSIAALMGAAILVTIAILTEKINLIQLIEKDIEWPTLMFFIFLFIIVGAVNETGLLALIADWILHLSHGSFVLSVTLIIWVAAIVSAFVDNIPFTATMLPIVAYLSQVIPGAGDQLWWALALGACFGGNGTIIGASANVVTMGIAESRGYHISFAGFMKKAFPYMLISVAIGQAWLLIFRPQ